MTVVTFRRPVVSRRLPASFSIMLLVSVACACATVDEFTPATTNVLPAVVNHAPVNKPQVNALPDVIGNADPELLEAGRQVIAALGDVHMLDLLASSDGLDVYPAMACKPVRLTPSRIIESEQQQTFLLDTCFDGEPPTTYQWVAYLNALANTPALTQTESIVLNQPMGIGIDTGTSYLVEQRFSEPTYQLIVYQYLGADTGTLRDWDEVGLVFEQRDQGLTLVAIYQDHFFHV